MLHIQRAQHGVVVAAAQLHPGAQGCVVLALRKWVGHAALQLHQAVYRVVNRLQRGGAGFFAQLGWQLLLCAFSRGGVAFKQPLARNVLQPQCWRPVISMRVASGGVACTGLLSKKNSYRLQGGR